ncbi:MAG: hypothetical protein V1676_03455 [Candidatus Diapherotrites archaeon]
MPADFVAGLAMSLFTLAKGGVICSILVFILVAPAMPVRSAIARHYKFGWLKSSAITSYLFVLVLVSAAYFYPLLAAMGEGAQTAYPDGLAPAPVENAAAFALSLIRVAAVAFVITLIIMPLVVLGAVLFDALSKRRKKANRHALVYVSVLAVTLASCAAVIFLLPWVPLGVLYLIFYAF